MPLNKETETFQHVRNNVKDESIIWRLNRVDFSIDDLKICLRIFDISVYQNSSTRLTKCEEHTSDTCSWGYVLGFNISQYFMSRVLTNGPGDQCSIPGRVIPKTQKWYLMPPCLVLSTIR